MYRLGPQPEEDSFYARPVMVRFNILAHRNRVWRQRIDITNEDGTKIRIQADLPKELREGMPLMYISLRAALKIKEFEGAKIRNYQLELNGEIYQVSDLEKLPTQLRPSTLSSPKSESTMVFFTRHSFLSNHHPSIFTIGHDTFHSMEQFLAFRRASMSSKQNLINKALNAQEPVQGKHILKSLKNDHTEEWNDLVPNIALEGLRAKFLQNHLRKKLCETYPLTMGEASKNARWGVGT